jgi:FG-GAP-like repeat/FG-GAP repeat
MRKLIALAALPVLLIGCGGDDYYGYGGCGNCGVTPVEVSYGVVAADFNGNGAGIPSVVALSSQSPPLGQNPSNLKVYLATGVGVYGAPTYVPDGDVPLWLATADLNGDNLNDVVTASYDDGALAVFLNDKFSPGTFNSPLVLSSPGASQVAIADVNGDGLPDLISADFNVSLFLQSSLGTFAAPISLYPGGANWVAVGDLNGDNAPDIALTDAVGVKVLMHTGAKTAATFAAPVSVFTQTANQDVIGANLIAIGDVDGDGLKDLVITDPGPTGEQTPTVNVLLQSAGGTFPTTKSYGIAPGDVSQSIVLADLEGSGRLDIVIGGLNTVTVLLHAATPGQFQTAMVYPAPGANQIAIADVNGDGKPDIVVSNGVTNPLVNGVITTHPGVLLQVAPFAGGFGPLQDLP